MIKDLEFIKILNSKEKEDCKEENKNKNFKVKCLLRDFLKNYPEDEKSLYHPDKFIQNFLKNFKFVASGGWASVYQFNLGDTDLKAVYKTYLNKGLYEYIIGLALNRLQDLTPNFMYTYAGIVCSTNDEDESISGLCEDEKNLDSIFFFEWVDGETLTKFLKNKGELNLKDKDIVDILSQIFFSLIIANNQFDFLHNDLHPDNILIEKLSNPIEIEYHLPNISKGVKIKTNYLVKIIDYGESDINREKVLKGISKDNVSYDITDIHKFVKWLKNDELSMLVKDNNFLENWIKINFEMF
jgi:serine/threonine protein kinase